ncbi:MAG TPA: UbiA family prenyltransferase [Kofleriaceae bacterium]|nr:UbiA family prenyltransferase [Kofleriaceae bacterium]
MTGAVLRLLRIPNVFTAAANVAAGAILARGGTLRAGDLALCAASACLYLAGMALNDYFDRDIDALERPERPIPSGEIAPYIALAIGVGLLGAGITLAALTAPAAGAVAAALAAAILLYDGGLKGGPLGPLAMGTCRFLNVCLGLSVVGPAPPSGWMWLAPATMGAYTMAITLLARDEVAGTSRAAARRAVGLVVGVLVAALAGLVLFSPAGDGVASFAPVAPIAVFIAWRARQVFAPLLAEPSPPALGRAIGGGILLMPAIDAAMVAAGGWATAALAIALLALPSLLLKRHFYMT